MPIYSNVPYCPPPSPPTPFQIIRGSCTQCQIFCFYYRVSKDLQRRRTCEWEVCRWRERESERESPLQVAMCLGCGRKPTWARREHANCTQRGHGRNSNSGPPHCEATVLPASSPKETKLSFLARNPCGEFGI